MPGNKVVLRYNLAKRRPDTYIIDNRPSMNALLPHLAEAARCSRPIGSC